MNHKKKILIFMGRYLPGYKDGGPVRSIKNLVDTLGDEYDFKIVTNDRDHGDDNAYGGIKIKEWNEVGKAQVYYVPPGGFSIRLLKKVSTQCDLIYLCGCFNDYSLKVLLLKRLGLIKKPVLVASMGLFSEGAFNINRRKKELFVKCVKGLGLFREVSWSATSELEVEDIFLKVGNDQKCKIAQDLPRQINENEVVYKNKKPGTLKIVFLSRITNKKNLLGAVNILKKLKGEVYFNIYGPKEDIDYWNICEEELKRLPKNINWNYNGYVSSEEVIDLFKKYDVFLFPTFGENYGHVIFEALSGGCIPIISDQTPWNDLERTGVGEVINISNIKEFTNRIQKYIQMDNKEFELISNKALQYAYQKSKDNNAINMYKNMFDREIEKVSK